MALGANWRISNGYCRVYPSATGGSSTKSFTVETYRSGSWVGSEFTAAFYNAGVFSAYLNTTGDATGYADPVVLTNSPSCVSISLPVPSTLGVAYGKYACILTLRNLDTFIEATYVPSTALNGYGFVRTTNTASTAFTGGVRATANDANGLRYLIAVHKTSTADTTKGGVTAGNIAAEVGQFAITADYQVGVATTDTGVRDLFYAARSDKRRVVVR
jgi:hypothetical protein